MKPGLFTYIRAENVQDAVSQMRNASGDASFLAGGQSLVPAMALRMAAPEVLIDISGISELQAITLDGGVLRIGAGCCCSDILRSDPVRRAAPLLAQAIPHIAHEAIRNRGTIGGSLVHADPASELPACMLALGADIVLRSGQKERKVAAGEFFLGTYFTAIAEDELLVAVEIPEIRETTQHVFLEIARRAGDYAMAGGAFAVDLERGIVSHARLAFFSVSDRAVLADAAAAALLGKPLTAETIAEVGRTVLGELEFYPDLYTGIAAKRQITKTLIDRMLRQLADQVQ